MKCICEERDLKSEIKLCIAWFGEYSSNHFETKILSLAHFLTELLQILLLKRCILDNFLKISQSLSRNLNNYV